MGQANKQVKTKPNTNLFQSKWVKTQLNPIFTKFSLFHLFF